jgi:hypothetical protein
MKKTLLALFIVSVFSSAFAVNNDRTAEKGKTTEATVTSIPATVSISGKVIDLTSGEALAGVEVSIEGSTTKVHTDFDGNFKIENLQPGAYNLIASYISYNKSFVEKLEVAKSNQPLNIKLQSAN